MTFPTWPTPSSTSGTSSTDRDARRPRDERGAVLPSPVVLLSIVAVALAAVAFVVTRDAEPTEREITTVADPSAPDTTDGAEPTDGADGDDGAEGDAGEEREPGAEPTEKQKPKPKPVERGEVGVVVFNNTGISGLAADVGAQVAEAGWSFVAADNWYGTVPATTVYYPDGMKREARQLALDLGVARVQPADTESDMSSTNLTLILTGALG